MREQAATGALWSYPYARRSLPVLDLPHPYVLAFLFTPSVRRTHTHTRAQHTHLIFLPLLAFVSTFRLTFVRNFCTSSHAYRSKTPTNPYTDAQ